MVEAWVGPNGDVDRIEVMEVAPKGQGFEEAAVEALESWEFEPGTRDGQSVEIYFTIVFDFRLE